MTHGERIKTVREMCKFTLAQAAKKIGVSASLISLWESDKRTIGSAQMMKVAHAYAVRLDYLLNCDHFVKFTTDPPKFPEMSASQKARYAELTK